MNEIQFLSLTCDNFHTDSLDSYIRDQSSHECWRFIDGLWQLIPCDYRFTWDFDRRRKVAAEVIESIRSGDAAFGAFKGNELIGFALLSLKRFGSEYQYAQLKLLQVSAPYRGNGIGRRLFEMTVETARNSRIPKLYISANSTKESQAAYRKLGCVYATEINEELATAEPFDVQMEYVL